MKRFQTSITLLLALFILTACAPCLDCGVISMDHRVTNIFTSATINPEYRYYYAGNDAEPDAIMGLRKEYTLTGGYWHEIELTSDHLAWWIESIETSRSLYIDEPHGYEMYTPDGSLAGLYYSRMEWLVVKFPEPGIIYVSTPEAYPWQREENEDDRGIGDYLRL